MMSLLRRMMNLSPWWILSKLCSCNWYHQALVWQFGVGRTQWKVYTLIASEMGSFNVILFPLTSTLFISRKLCKNKILMPQWFALTRLGWHLCVNRPNLHLKNGNFFLFIQVKDNLEIDKEGKETWTQRQIQTNNNNIIKRCRKKNR
jgi:hypothetical protein